MVLKLQKHKDNHLDCRLVSLNEDKTVKSILGYVWGFVKFDNYWYRATVTHSGTVYGRDCQSQKEACRFIVDKREELGI